MKTNTNMKSKAIFLSFLLFLGGFAFAQNNKDNGKVEVTQDGVVVKKGGETVVVTKDGVNIIRNSVKITGVVVDAQSNEALIGASVLQKGSSFGTMTDVDGQFSLNTSQGSVIQISFLGYKSQEITVQGETKLNIRLEPNTELLGEVVVVGYGTKKAGAITGSVAQVRSAEILKTPAQSAVQSIQGKAVGVNIVATDEPGKSPTVMIRGINTVLGGRNPLYVIDGIEATSLNGLSANDIATMDILKDASSLAIYGNKAASGVILITTKKGNKGEIKVNYDGNVGAKSIQRTVEMADSYRFAYYQNFATGQPRYSQEQPYNTDWLSEITRTGITTNNAISLSGGSENANYYFGASRYTEKGILKGTDYDRTNILSKNDYRLFNDRLKILQSINISVANNAPKSASAFTSAYKQAPMMPVKYDNGKWGMPFLDTSTGLIGTTGEKFNNVANPVAMLGYTTEKNRNVTLTGSVGAEIKILNELKFNSNFGATYDSGQGYTYTSNEENWFSQNPTATEYPNKYYSTLQQRRSSFFVWNWDNFLTYNKSFNAHDVTAVVGVTRSTSRTTQELSATRYNVPYQSNYWALNLSKNDDKMAPSTIITNTNQTPLVNLGYFVRGDYAYNDRYLLTASLRRDGISDFTGKNKWGLFPAISGGWIISDEDFFETLTSFIDFLKIKVGYGEIGNGNATPSVNQVLFNNGATYPFGIGEIIYPGSYVPYAVDPDLTWETTKEIGFGFDAHLLQQRLSGSVEFYNRKTDNVILPVKLHAGLSPDPVFLNTGVVENKGVEISLNWKDKIGESVTYTIGGNIAFNKNSVKEIYSSFFDKLTGGDLGNGQYTKEIHKGDPIGSFYVYQVTGFSVDGAFTYSDERVYAGSYIPTYTYGFNLGVEYKKLEFSMDLYGVGGNKVYNGKKAQRSGGENVEMSELKDFWIPSNPDPNAKNPRPFADTPRPSTYYIEDGAFLRVNNITLAYKLPTIIKEIDKLRIFATATNPFILTKYSGFSPELSGSDNGNPLTTAGIELDAYPTNKTFSVGLNVQF